MLGTRPRFRLGRRSLLVAAAAFTVLAFGACGGSAAPQRRADTTVRASDPVRLPPRTRFTRPGSPGEAVMRLFRYMQLGALPAAVSVYAQQALRNVGAEDFAGALQSQREEILNAQPRIRAVENAPGGTLVILTLRYSDHPSQTYTYTLRRLQNRWVVVYDTLLDDAIRSFATNRAQARLDPAANGTSSAAARAGLRAASAFRRTPF